VERLAAFDAGAASAAVTLTPRARGEVVPIVEHRSARTRYSLLLDPVGSLPFAGPKPRRWLMTAPLDGLPANAFALELELCPMRGNSEPVLASYAVAGAPPFVLREAARGGLTVDLGGRAVASGVYLDYAQWQRIAVAWDERAGSLRLYKDDGARRVAAEGAGTAVEPLGAPVFEGEVGEGARVAPGGVLAVGQLQGRPGLIADFAARREFRGALAEVRVWSSPPDFASPAAREPAEHESGLLGRWRLSALGVEVGEAAAAGAPVGLIGGFRGGELRDVRRLRVVADDGRQAWASAPVVEVGREQRIEMAREPGGGLVLWHDGRELALAPLDPADLARDEQRGFRVGALDDLTELRLGSGDDPRALYRCDGALGDRLEDRSGSGLDLVVGP
jgi:hypothetical protein